MIHASRLFTVEQANRMLPLVRRIVEDIVRHHALWQEQVRLFEVAAADVRPDQPSAEAEHYERRAQALAEEIAGFIDELEALDVEFKGFDLGLVDFPGERDGHPIYYCWQLGEPSVRFWHDRDAGFAGRQPL